jgi:hypothetical protein
MNIHHDVVEEWKYLKIRFVLENYCELKGLIEAITSRATKRNGPKVISKIDKIQNKTFDLGFFNC